MSKPRVQVQSGENLRAPRGRKAGAIGALQYTGASSIARELIGWVAGRGDADASVWELETLRDRSQDLARNAPLVAGAVLTHRNETVGTGLRLQSRVNPAALRRAGVTLPEERISDLSEALEELWRYWAEDPRECDIEQTRTFYDLQDLCTVSEIVAGEFVCLMTQRQRVDSPWMMRMQDIDAARLANPDGRPNVPSLRGGVERNGDGAVFRYHFRERHPQATAFDARGMRFRAVNRYVPSSGRQQVFHVFRADRSDQSRGIPLLAPVISKLKQGDRYIDSEVMAALVGGMLSVIFEQESGDVPDFDSDDDVKSAGEAAGVDTENELAMGHGTMMVAPPGTKATTVAPGRPNPQFDAFLTSLHRHIGSALELPYEVFIGHFQSSYSAARAALLKAWKGIITRRMRITRHFCQPVYQNLVFEAVARGMIDLPGFARNPMARRAWMGAVWVGPPRGAIDPVKEYSAELMLNDAGVRTLADVTQQLTGEDWDTVVPRIAREQQRMRELGVMSGRATAPVDTDADEPDNAERHTG